MGALTFPTLDSVIAKFEGFGTPAAPTITGANNPGAIQSGPFARSAGSIGSSNGFAVFPDAETGFAAIDQLVARYAEQGANLRDLINAWSPPNAPGNTPASTQNYLNFAAQQTGASPDTPVSSLANPSTWQKIQGIIGGTLGAAANPNNPAGGAIGGAASAAAGVAGTGTNWITRVVTVVLGLILIGGAIFLLGFGSIEDLKSKIV